jgi:hypothetical protein
VEPASPLPLLLTPEQMSEVFNPVGCCASFLREVVCLPSLLVYGVDGVIFSPIVTWPRSRCFKLEPGCVGSPWRDGLDEAPLELKNQTEIFGKIKK